MPEVAKVMRKKSVTKPKTLPRTPAKKTKSTLTSNLLPILKKSEARLDEVISELREAFDNANLQTHLGLADIQDQMQKALAWVEVKRDSLQHIASIKDKYSAELREKSRDAKADVHSSTTAALESLERMRGKINASKKVAGKDMQESFDKIKDVCQSIYQQLIH